MSKKEPKEPKQPKQPKESKKKIVENKGITGMGTDYTVYILSARERLLAMIAGFLVGFVASYVYYNSALLGVIVGLIAGYKAISLYSAHLLKKRSKELRLQFRDMLESLSNSYTVGLTATRAFHNALSDMTVEHGQNAYITNELRLICATHDNQGVEIKDMMNDFAARSGIDDVRSFASVFDVSTNLGGDVAKIIRETRDMISDKIEIELEIQTMVTGQKNQLNVLALMPFVMSMLTQAFSSNSGNILVIIIKSVALVVFVFAYWLGTRIVNIKV